MTHSDFEKIAEQLRQKALKTGLDFFGNREDAEDAAQDTMVQLWRYLEHIDGQRNVEALAVRVAKNCCVSMYRKRKTGTPPLAEQGETAMFSREAASFSREAAKFSREAGKFSREAARFSCEASPQEQLEAKDTQRMLSETLDLLKPRERQLFDMRALMGLSIDEITQQTGIPKPSVTAMVSAARKKVFTELRRRMKQ